jgi:hypothetical protein
MRVPRSSDATQQEPESVPAVEEFASIAAVPVIAHGVPTVTDSVDGLGARMPGRELTPPTPSSVEPSGMPTRPMPDEEAIPVGDEADAAG